MKLPILYKLTSSGKIQEWQIETVNNKIITIHGQKDGKQQVCEEIIYQGKNIGKTNETTPAQQAEAEAQSRWNKKHDKDYKLSVEECQTDVKISNEGGYLPMLAHEYKKHAEKYLKYPCYVQPKLDGIRCIATKDKNVRLWFRNGKEITTMSHIAKALEKVMKNGDIFDGELYIHGKDFNEFTGAIRANKNLNEELTSQIQYHIYDVPRISNLKETDIYIKRLEAIQKTEINFPLVLVDTQYVNNFEEALEYYKEKIEERYEGIIFRNTSMIYEQKRSYNLLKYKEFIDDEFEIISIEEGRGKLAGHVGAFICKIEANRTLQDIGDKSYKHGEDYKIVRAKMEGKIEYLKHLFEHPEECLGKMLTIKYQNLSKDGIPRFPVGKTIRFDK